MQLYVIGGLSFLAVYTAYYLLSALIASRRHAQKAASLGCKRPPVRPSTLPLGINLVQQILKADREQRVPDMFVDIYEELGCPGTWRQRFLGVESFVTMDPKNIQAILATQFNDFNLGHNRRRNFVPMLGYGIFTVDGKMWEHSRALLRPQFARDQVADLDLEEIHVQNLLKHLPTNDAGWTDKVDLQPLFFNLTLDSATEFLFGESVLSQLLGLPGESKQGKSEGKLDWSTFSHDWDHATMALGRRARLADAYWMHNPKSFRDSCKRINEFADYYVNLALSSDSSSLKEQSTSSGQKRDRYVFLHEIAKSTRDPIALRSQLLNILVAGRDTTAGLLGWTFFILARHPAVYSKLRSVVMEHFGTFSKPHSITFANLKSCTYLQHVLQEILRLYPNVPLNSRTCVRDTTLPRGGGPDGNSPIYVRAGQEVSYLCHVMHHRKDIWGEDAEDFKPERWVGRKVGWEYVPFNGGPRVCLGQQFALTEAGYVTVRLVQRFAKLENADEREARPKHVLSLTTSTDGCWVRMKEGTE